MSGRRKPAPGSRLEDQLAFQIKAAGLPVPRTQFKFAAPDRLWRADFAWLDPYWLLVEVDGGTFIAGRHSRGAGIREDFEKLNDAVVRGWRVLRFEVEHVKRGYALTTIERALARHVWPPPTILGDALFTLSEPEEPKR